MKKKKVDTILRTFLGDGMNFLIVNSEEGDFFNQLFACTIPVI